MKKIGKGARIGAIVGCLGGVALAIWIDFSEPESYAVFIAICGSIGTVIGAGVRAIQKKIQKRISHPRDRSED